MKEHLGIDGPDGLTGNFEQGLEREPANFEQFREGEKALTQKTVDSVGDLAMDKFKSKSAAMAVALSMLFSASTAFAGGQEESSDENYSDEELSQHQVRNDIDWAKFFNKLEMSYSYKDTSTDTFKDAGYWNPYSRVDAQGSYDVSSLFSRSLSSSNFSNFSESLNEGSENWSDHERLLFLHEVGEGLARTYNYDMLEKNEHVRISEDSMLKGLRSVSLGKVAVTGICGNIHSFVTKTATSMGMESWMQTGSTFDGGHVWSGVVAEIDGQKQIVFIDYGTVIPTYTLNYRDALGIAERYMGGDSLFNSYVTDSTDKVLFPVKSKAQEKIEEAVGIGNLQDDLEASLSSGKIERPEDGISFKLSESVTQLKINKGILGFSTYKFEDESDPYQSLRSMEASGISLKLGGDQVGVEARVTKMHSTLKDLSFSRSGSDIDETVATLALNFVDQKELTKGDYGKFLLNFGAALRIAAKFSGGNHDADAGLGESALGARMVYIDPNNFNKFYVEASAIDRVQNNDVQDQSTQFRAADRNLTVGSEVNVREASVKLEATKKNADWGDSSKLSLGVKGGKWSGNISYEKSNSDYERFVPDSKKVEASVSYKPSPKMEIDLVGAGSSDTYKDSKSYNSSYGEVKLRIYFW